MASLRSRPAPNAMRRHRLHGAVAHDLAIEIVSGRLAPGELLPREEDLGTRLRVSRTVVREAVKMLGAKGLLQSRPRSGTRVAPREAWNLLDPDVLAWHLKAEPSRSFIQAIYELRRLVEPGAAAMAAERASDQQLDPLRRAFQALATTAPGTSEDEAADIAFHASILQASGNEAVLALLPVVTATLTWAVQLTAKNLQTAKRESLPIHRRLMERIVDRDPDGAQRACTELISRALADTMRALDARTALRAACKPRSDT